MGKQHDVAGQHAPPAPPEHPRRGRGDIWRDETEHAARTQHLRDLGQGADRIGEVLEHVDHEHGVEGAGFKAGVLQVALEHLKAEVPGPPHRPVGQLDALGAPAAAAGLVQQQPDPTADVQDQGRAIIGEIGAGRREKLPAGHAAGSLLGDVRLVDHLGVRGLQLVLDHPGLENPTTWAAVQLRLLARVVAGRGDLLAGGGGGRTLKGQRQLGGAADPTGRGGQSRPSRSLVGRGFTASARRSPGGAWCSSGVGPQRLRRPESIRSARRARSRCCPPRCGADHQLSSRAAQPPRDLQIADTNTSSLRCVRRQARGDGGGSATGLAGAVPPLDRGR